jgi:hypothetical protein
MGKPWRAALIASIAAGCGPGPVRVVDPVTLVIPAAPPATAEPPIPGSPHPELHEHRIQGVWREEFQSRAGCADTVTISGSGKALVIEGSDCNGGSAYTFSDLKYDGTTLSVELRVAETGYVVQYTLHWLPDGSLGGEAVVVGGPEPAPYKVRWARQR